MFDRKFQRAMCALALTGAVGCGSFPVHADDRDDDQSVKKVFVIAMENHNWTQPSTQTSPHQIFQNPAAQFINGLVNGMSGISNQVAYALYALPPGAVKTPFWLKSGTVHELAGSGVLVASTSVSS